MNHARGIKSIGFNVYLQGIVPVPPEPRSVPIYSSGQFSLTNPACSHRLPPPYPPCLQYICDEELSSSEAVIDAVDEERSCEYLLSVSVGSLCSLKAFLPVDRPHKPAIVQCRPLLEEADVRAALAQEIALKKRQVR